MMSQNRVLSSSPPQGNVNSRHFISFPKSGRTWLRYILHQMGVDQLITFHHDGFEFNDPSKPVQDFSLSSRCEKYSKVDRIVYLRRDPRDVIVSFYYQITGRFRDIFNYQGEISDFIRDDYFGAYVLARFLSMWEQLANNLNILVIDYEECHQDLAGVARRVLAHFDIQISDEMIDKAIKMATFERMKELEDSGSFPAAWLNRRNGASKVRTGKVGNYLNVFSQQDLDFLSQTFSGFQLTL